MADITISVPEKVARVIKTNAATDVLIERARQVHEEGWDAEHDADHNEGELARAAACYAISGSLDDAKAYRAIKESPTDRPEAQTLFGHIIGCLWPNGWDWEWWKPKNRRRDLVRAAALLLAEIEAMDRRALLEAEESKKRHAERAARRPPHLRSGARGN